jgi:tRNA threonylcarbamoyladenosine biosynthesis protein TsaE
MTTSGTELVLRSESAEATLEIGRALGRACAGGLVIALIGPLGAGKTQLVRGIAEGLDVSDPRVVSSPTFVLIQEYTGRIPIYHFDTYRLGSSDQFAALGPEEYFFGDGVSIVEWADRVAECLPSERLEIRIEVYPESQRALACRAIGASASRALESMREQIGG